MVNSATIEPAVKHEIEPGGDVGVEDASNGGAGGPRIRCPKCNWSPRAEDLWLCKCGFMWNTFDTGGVCPACLKQWAETQCLLCSGWSAHSDWYAE